MKPVDARDDEERQAQQWLLHLRSGKVTPGDLRAFRRWCADHPRTAQQLRTTWTHLREASSRVAQQQAAADFPGEVYRGARDPSAPARSSRSSRSSIAHLPRPGRRAFVGAAVAAGATWLAVRPPLQLWPALGELTADYRTATGEQRRIALGRGVTVTMNTQTRIDVLPASAGGSGSPETAQGASRGASDEASRGIQLLAGEAEIVTGGSASSSDVSSGFTVVAGAGRLQVPRAQQAQFDVRRTDAQVCVTCISGRVAVTHPRRQLTLTEGEQLIYDDRFVRPVSRVDSAAVTAWRRGVLVFDGMPLAQVIDEINRYRPGKVILRNAALGTASVEAQSPITRLDALIDTLSQAYGAHVTKLPGSIVLLS